MSLLNVVVVEETADDKIFQNILQDNSCQVFHLTVAKFAVDLLLTITPDIIIFNVAKPKEAIFQIIIDINQNYRIPVVLFSEDHNTETINKVIKAGASAYIVDGIETKRIKSIIDIAIIRFKEQLALKDELAETKSKLEDRKLIDRAKGILIKSQNFTEDQAYHAIRKLAMERNVSIAEMAKNVIAMTGLFSPNN